MITCKITDNKAIFSNTFQQLPFQVRRVALYLRAILEALADLVGQADLAAQEFRLVREYRLKIKAL